VFIEKVHLKGQAQETLITRTREQTNMNVEGFNTYFVETASEYKTTVRQDKYLFVGGGGV
jgi:hypothetical protein